MCLNARGVYFADAQGRDHRGGSSGDKERRKTQVCRTYQLKVDKSHLSNATQEHLHRLFLETKWFYNYILAQGNVWNRDYKITKVTVKTMDGALEERELTHLSAQMRQEIIDRAKDNIRGLSELKKNGHRIGALKFKSRNKSIPLKQYCKTYQIRGKKYVGIQNIKQPLRVMGLEQIPEGAELTSATLKQGMETTSYTSWRSRQSSKRSFRRRCLA